MPDPMPTTQAAPVPANPVEPDPLYQTSSMMRGRPEPEPEKMPPDDIETKPDVEEKPAEEAVSTEAKGDAIQEAEKTDGSDKETEEAVTTDEQTVKEAKAVIQMAKEDPEGFLKSFGNTDFFGSRFAKLGKESAALRKREQDIKAKETEVAEHVEDMKLLRSDPVAFVEKYLGRSGYERWTRAILSKDDPSFKQFETLHKEIAELKQQLADSKKTEAAPENDEARVQAENQSKEFWSGFNQEASKPEYSAVIAWEGGEDSFSRSALALAREVLSTHGELLTGQRAAAILKKTFDERQARVNSLSKPEETPESDSPKQKEAPADGKGPKTLTSSLQSDVALSESEDWEGLSDSEKMRRIAAKYGS